MKRNSISTGLAVRSRAITTTRNLIKHRAWFWVVFLAFAASAFGLQRSRAAVTEAWVQRHSNVANNATDQALKVVLDATGDVIVTGTTSGFQGGDMVTIKYSGSDGSVLWRQRYNSPSNVDDRPTALAVDRSGNVVVTGYSESSRIYIAKYAASNGKLLWEKYGPAIGSEWQNPANLAVEGNGNVVVTGSSWNGTDFESYTGKYAAADGAPLWERRGPAHRYGYATAVAVDGSGNVVITGSSNDTNSNPGYCTAKYAAANGALLWERRYNGTANYDDGATAVAVDGSGNVMVTGYSRRESVSNIYDYYTAKYAAANGALLWERRGPTVLDIWQYTANLAVDGSGNAVITGRFWNDGSDGSNYDYYTAKYAAADGAIVWEQRYNGLANGNDEPSAVAVDGRGNVVVTGRAREDWNSGYDYYTAKYAAANGALLWERRYNGPRGGDDYANAVAVDSNGRVVVTGRADSFQDALLGAFWGGNYYTASYAAADGALVWEQTYDGSATTGAAARAVVVDGAGNVVVAGVSGSHFDSFGTSKNDYYTAKYAAVDGTLLWERRGPAITDTWENPAHLAVDGNGDIVVTGYSWNNETRFDYYTAKYAAADGALLWEKRYNSPANQYDIAKAVAVDGSGNIVVTGYSWSKGGEYDYYTAKYAALDGTLLWEKRYNGPANSDDAAKAVAVDSNGNVVVTGYSWNVTNGTYYTAKYAAADGALLWERRGPAIREIWQNPAKLTVAADGSGNVVVSGTSYKGTISHFYTAKYAAADGALLWERRYNGPANRSDSANAVAVDGIGNVLVTGYSSNGTDNDYYTVKYAAADGALLWEKRYSGPANSDDSAKALAVDGRGNVVVTGNSGSDCYTASFAAADGALLWEKRFTGAASVADSPRSLALGPDGTVAVTGSSNGGYVTVVYREVPAVSIDLVSASIRLRVTGLPGRSYRMERAPALTGPWSTINIQIAPASGLFEYLDTGSPGAAAFYRTSAP